MRLAKTTPSAIVLLAQPERDDRDVYSESLRRRCFLPVPVPAAIDALALAPHVDIVVTDILLHGHIDGVELVARLKTDDRTRTTPVIVLTPCAWQSERDRARAAGCDLFLAKPCLPDLLISEIDRLLALYRLPKPQPAPAPYTPKVRHRRVL